LDNFPTRARRLRDVHPLRQAYSWVKGGASLANVQLGVLDED